MHEVLVNRLGGLSLPRKSVVRLTGRPDMTLDVYRGRKTTIILLWDQSDMQCFILGPLIDILLKRKRKISKLLPKLLDFLQFCLTLLHLGRPKLYTILAILSAIGLILFNPTALRKDKIVYNFGHSECN